MKSKRSNRDPHLESVRMAHRYRVGGKPFSEIGRLVPEQTSAAGAKLLVAEYHERRKSGTLFSDIDDIKEADLYKHASIMQQAQKSPAVSNGETKA